MVTRHGARCTILSHFCRLIFARMPSQLSRNEKSSITDFTPLRTFQRNVSETFSFPLSFFNFFSFSSLAKKNSKINRRSSSKHAVWKTRTKEGEKVRNDRFRAEKRKANRYRAQVRADRWMKFKWVAHEWNRASLALPSAPSCFYFFLFFFSFFFSRFSLHRSLQSPFPRGRPADCDLNDRWISLTDRFLLFFALRFFRKEIGSASNRAIFRIKSKIVRIL